MQDELLETLKRQAREARRDAMADIAEIQRQALAAAARRLQHEQPEESTE